MDRTTQGKASLTSNEAGFFMRGYWRIRRTRNFFYCFRGLRWAGKASRDSAIGGNKDIFYIFVLLN